MLLPHRYSMNPEKVVIPVFLYPLTAHSCHIQWLFAGSYGERRNQEPHSKAVCCSGPGTGYNQSKWFHFCLCCSIPKSSLGGQCLSWFRRWQEVVPSITVIKAVGEYCLVCVHLKRFRGLECWESECSYLSALEEECHEQLVSTGLRAGFPVQKLFCEFFQLFPVCTHNFTYMLVAGCNSCSIPFPFLFTLSNISMLVGMVWRKPSWRRVQTYSHFDMLSPSTLRPRTLSSKHLSSLRQLRVRLFCVGRVQWNSWHCS